MSIASMVQSSTETEDHARYRRCKADMGQCMSGALPAVVVGSAS